MKYTHRLSGTKIGDVLATQGRRQDWLAEQIGVSPAALNRWIRGTRTVDLETARSIARVLDTDFFLLFDVPTGTHLVHESEVA